MPAEQNNEMDFKIDRSKLYREETYSDLKSGMIKRLVPVKPDGSEDKSRKQVFIGHTNLISPNGPVPIQNVIQAKELQQAIKKFPEAMQEAMERLIEEVKKYQEKERNQIETPESRIIIPGR
jgi:predicted esterase